MSSLHLKEIINSARGKYVLSILLGLGLATLFRRACKDRNCLVFRAPKISEIKGKIFGHNDKCYTYTEKNSTCKNSPENVVLEVEN
jgi:hypothetical protein